MIPINRTYAPLQAFVEELARCGMRLAFTSPGSRNAPLALTLDGQPGIEAHSVIDERAAGFAALGAAKASGRPVAIACTSGSAAANLLPAVVEAHEAGVPMIVMTADRPPELRDTGAGQAIDQLKLYGDYAKWFVEVGNHEPALDSAIYHRSLACRAWHTARTGRPGVVHLNFPLREPLAPVAEELDAGVWAGRDDGSPWVELLDQELQPAPEVVEQVASRIVGVERGAIVCGTLPDGAGESVAELAAAIGWPVLADATSGLRFGPHDRSHVVAHYDALLRSDSFARAMRPAVTLRFGATPTSKPLRAWLRGSPQIVVDPYDAWDEPTRVAETAVRASPVPLCEALASRVEVGRDPQWMANWARADAVVPAALESIPDPFEPKAFNAGVAAAGDGSTIWVASSMPIRDVETFLPPSSARLSVLSNRGANGIDGTVSSAVGAALATRGRVVLLTGELALVHDVSGLLAARRLGVGLTIVCANNGGGGIFDFLPVSESAPAGSYERHIATPSGTDLDELAAAGGLEHRRVDTPQEIAAAARDSGLIEVRSDRRLNVERHREVFSRVARELDELAESRVRSAR